jgi:hypothetical protein
VTEDDRRVAALAALLAPTRALCVLGRLATPSARELADHAGRLLAAPRRERLQALAASLAHDGRPHASAGSVAAVERKAIAAVLRALAASTWDDRGVRVSPVVLRLCRERLGR